MKVKPPINALAQYLMALAAVIGCYSLYFRHAVPIIEGPPNLIQRPKSIPLADLPSPREEKSHLIPFLPTDSWELGDCKTLLTQSGTILFKDLEEQPDGSLKVTPFTLFSGLDDPSKIPDLNLAPPNSSPPTVLRCIDGANLKFDKPISDVFAGNEKAELSTARLTGNVDIYRPPTGPENNDAMHIMTSNVQVDKQRIYTLDNVQFVFGSNKASGRNLLIDLEHQESPMGADFSNISGVRRMELAFLYKLRIEPVGSNSMVLDNGSPSKPKLFSNQKSPIEVSCSGPFVFDFDKNVATFEQEVVAQQLDSFQDSIECDMLTLKFKEKENQQSAQTTEATSPLGKAKGDLELTAFLAQGSPAIVVSRSSSAKITGELLSYDIDSSEIVARCSPQTDQMVTILSDELQMVSKEIRYVVPEDKSLGEVNAMGPGRMLQPKTKERDEFFASWTKSLTTRNDPQRIGLKRIMLEGDTSVRIADETQTNADQLEVLLWQLPIANENPGNGEVQKWDYQPFQIVAQGNVSIISPKVSGFSQQMTAIWPRRTTGAVQTQTRTPRPEHRVGYRGSLQTQTQNHEYGTQNYRSTATTPWKAPNPRSISTPAAIQQATPLRRSDFIELTAYDAPDQSIIGKADLNQGSSSKADKAEEKAIEFRGQNVEVRLQESEVDSKKQTQIVDLTVIGDVRVLQRPAPSPTQSATDNEQPIVIKGDQLRLTPQGDKTYRAVVSSKPLSNQTVNPKNAASISAKGFELFGSDINLDQKANKVWVEGAGSMKINPDSIREAQEKPSDKPLTSALKDSVPQNLDVTWEGGMIFDGAKIYFERNVAMAASQNGKPKENEPGDRYQIKSFSEGLSVELDKPINFADLTGDKQSSDSAPDAQIRELIFVSEIPKSKRAFQLAAHDSASQPANQKNPHVVVENRTFDKSGTLIQKQNIVVPNVTFNVQAGGIFAKGPGTIATHRVGTPGSDKSNPLAKLASTDREKTEKKQSLSFIQVNFDGELNIDPDQKEMTVVGNVRTIYAPIGSWEKAFNPDSQRKDAPPGSVNLRCDRLQLAQWASRSDKKSFTEMLATGNTHLYSDAFEATANRVSYSQASDVLVVEGTPRTDANLWFKQTPNDRNPTHLIAEKISYRISDQRTQIQSVKNMNINSK